MWNDDTKPGIFPQEITMSAIPNPYVLCFIEFLIEFFFITRGTPRAISQIIEPPKEILNAHFSVFTFVTINELLPSWISFSPVGSCNWILQKDRTLMSISALIRLKSEILTVGLMRLSKQSWDQKFLFLRAVSSKQCLWFQPGKEVI